MLVLAMEFSRGAHRPARNTAPCVGPSVARVVREAGTRGTGIAEEATVAAPSKRNSEVRCSRRTRETGPAGPPLERDGRDATAAECFVSAE